MATTFGTPDVRTFGELFGPIATYPHLFGEFGLLGPALPSTDYTTTLILQDGSSSTSAASSGTTMTLTTNDGSTTTQEL